MGVWEEDIGAGVVDTDEGSEERAAPLEESGSVLVEICSGTEDREAAEEERGSWATEKEEAAVEEDKREIEDLGAVSGNGRRAGIGAFVAGL